MVAELVNHPAWPILRGRVQGWRETYFKNLGDQLYQGQIVLADSDLDFKRGYFKGISRLLNEPAFTQKQLERDLNRKESDSE